VWAIIISSDSYHDEFFGLEMVLLWGAFTYCALKVVAVLLGLIASFKSWKPLLCLVSIILHCFCDIILIVICRVLFILVFGLSLSVDYFAYC